MKSLYAYFGLIDLHDIDSPGHSLYQLGLVDSISETYGDIQFDFYSYYPDKVIKDANIQDFPNTQLGQVFSKYQKSLFNPVKNDFDSILFGIKNKSYSRLYLKARFRNISTLSKKWKDAQEFERIINTAIQSGYNKESIIILDTDLSLSDSFVKKYSHWVTILIPSIDFPGISNRFLMDCLDANKKSGELGSVFYGNIDTSKYKAGNNKSSILLDVLNWVNSHHNIVYSTVPFTVICKESDFNLLQVKKNTKHIDRKDRVKIWEALASSRIMLNITKEKYNTLQFIPARIYEALIFGLIPISYKFDFLSSAFSFNDIEELVEIYNYLGECDSVELEQAFSSYVKTYLAHVSSLSITR
jgi:hypothetical protein